MFEAKKFLASVSDAPGVYQMFDAKGVLLYIGKAKNLKKRLSSYFRKNLDQAKTAVLVRQIAEIKILLTQTENEALILENNLIKAHKPKYNILFKDDKNYPYLIFSNGEFPRLDLIRTHKTPKGEYFGPFPNGGAAKETQQLIEKLFLLRNCSDNFFAHRSRPCLQYHIKRCSAPCVDLISAVDYQKNLALAKLFLQGKNKQIIGALTQKMEDASEETAYEKAALYRDQIQMLRQIEAEQTVQKGHQDFDVIGSYEEEGLASIQLLRIRLGKIVGSQSFFSENSGANSSTLLEYFIEQHYLAAQANTPKQIFLDHTFENKTWISEALSQHAGYKIHLKVAARGIPLNLAKMARHNAEQNVRLFLAQRSSIKNRFDDLENALDLPKDSLNRLECFDISHTFGEATVASCVVFDREGPNKKAYRIFNIEGVTAGDDFAAMHQALTRRFKNAKDADAVLPDLLIIDGGKGQLKQAIEVFKTLDVHSIVLLGVAKGPTRKAGFETLWLPGKDTPLNMEKHSAALHLVQHIRDEAHRFAITKHRAKRGKSHKTSLLEAIPGVGSKKRQALLKHFGGLQGLQQASLKDIAKVEGIGNVLAEKIMRHL